MKIFRVSNFEFQILRRLAFSILLFSVAAPAEQVDAPPPAPLVTTAPVEYTVEEGDTLMGISRKAYGDSSGWRAIYQVNEAKLKESGGIRRGLILTLPVSPDGPEKIDFSAEPLLPAKGTFQRVDITVQRQLEESLAELTALRQKIVMEKIPLSRSLRDLEDELIRARRSYQQTTRLLDSRTLDLSNLRSEIKSRNDEKNYLSNLLGEYIRNVESRLHIAELHRYEKVLEAARLAPENNTLSDLEIYQTQAALVRTSLDRLHDALEGTRFEGTAVDADGIVKKGTFALLGPAALFRSADGRSVGTAEQRLGSLEPAIIGFDESGDTKAAEKLVKESSGLFVFDPTLGNAHKIEATKQTLWEHIRKGGLTMVPILGLAAAALLVAVFKWVQLSRLRSPTEHQLHTLLRAVAKQDTGTAMDVAQSVQGPAGGMLASGIEHIKEPRDLIEEVMYEKMLSAKLKLQSLLPFVAISASSAPLLGLLGTVTGIINTFKLITVFGSGDVKMLSGGISEALITTEFGLIVAIPSLLFHAFLSRKARGMIDQMEKAAVSFMNQLSKTPYGKSKDAA